MAKLSEAATGWPHSVQPSFGRYHLAPVKKLVEIWIFLRANLYTNPHIKARYIQVVKVGICLKLLVPFVEEVGPAL
jgi:hypothetical protein